MVFAAKVVPDGMPNVLVALQASGLVRLTTMLSVAVWPSAMKAVTVAEAVGTVSNFHLDPGEGVGVHRRPRRECL